MILQPRSMMHSVKAVWKFDIIELKQLLQAPWSGLVSLFYLLFFRFLIDFSQVQFSCFTYVFLDPLQSLVRFSLAILLTFLQILDGWLCTAFIVLCSYASWEQFTNQPSHLVKLLGEYPMSQVLNHLARLLRLSDKLRTNMVGVLVKTQVNF